MARPARGLQRPEYRRRLDRDGLLQRPAGRCALLRIPGGSLLDERQLPPVSDGGNGRESRDAGHGRCDLVQRRPGARAAASAQSVAGGGSANEGTVDEIENPDPQPGTNNWYTQDGYGCWFLRLSIVRVEEPIAIARISTLRRGCAGELSAVASRPIDPRCERGHYYLLNNYAPGYYEERPQWYADITESGGNRITIPPSTLRNIGDALDEKKVSWAYLGDHGTPVWPIPTATTLRPTTPIAVFCNPFSTRRRSCPALPDERHNQDTAGFYQAIQNGNLPAVSS